jgi:hypothetical protein
MMGLKEDVEGNPMEDDTGLGSWFYSRRDNFGPNGWDKLLGPVECRTIKADHFSMVTPPAVCPLGSTRNVDDELTFFRPTTLGNCYRRQWLNRINFHRR